MDRQGKTKIRGRLRDADAARHVDEDVGLAKRGRGSLLEYCDQHVQSVDVRAAGDAPRRVVVGGLVDQALDLDEQRSRAFEHDHHRRARGRNGRIAEDRGGRVRDLFEAFLAHGEDADLLGRPEAVLHGSQDAELLPPVALQVKHRVNDMLEDPGPGDRPLFRDVAHEEDRNADLLGQPHESRGRLAHLRDAARAAFETCVGDGLDGVDDRQLRGLRADRLADRVEVGLGKEKDSRRQRAEPRGAHPNLLRRFLARGVENLPAIAASDLLGHMHEQRRLADARLPSHQHHAARHDATSEHAVELAPRQAAPGRRLRLDLVQRHGPIRHPLCRCLLTP